MMSLKVRRSSGSGNSVSQVLGKVNSLMSETVYASLSYKDTTNTGISFLATKAIIIIQKRYKMYKTVTSFKVARQLTLTIPHFD